MKHSGIASPSPRSGDAGESKRLRLGHLDALRGIAFLLVLAVHALTVVNTLAAKPWLKAVIDSGQRGVELFYVVSAFTLFLSLDMDRHERHPLLNFFVRRFFRIAPLFYLAIVANWLTGGAAGLTGWQIFSGFIFANGLIPAAINSVALGGWSIAVETSFYVFVPLLHRVLRTTQRALIAVCIAALVGWLYANRFAHGANTEYFSFLSFPVQLPVFLMGVLAYCLWRDWERMRTPARDAAARGIAGTLLLTSLVLWVASLSTEVEVAGVVPWRNQHLYTASFMFVSLVLALSIAPVRLLDNAFTRFLGKISYSLYLSHFYAVDMVRAFIAAHPPIRRNYQPWLGYGTRAWGEVYLAILLLAVAMSVVLFYAVEQPGMRLGRWMIALWEKPRAQPPLPEPTAIPSTPDAQF